MEKRAWKPQEPCQEVQKGSVPKEVAYQLLSFFPAPEWEMKKKVLRGNCGDMSPEPQDWRSLNVNLPFVAASGWGDGSKLSWNDSSDSRFTADQQKQHIF